MLDQKIKIKEYIIYSNNKFINKDIFFFETRGFIKRVWQELGFDIYIYI